MPVVQQPAQWLFYRRAIEARLAIASALCAKHAAVLSRKTEPPRLSALVVDHHAAIGIAGD
jgi:hypothetical protein